MRAVAPLPIRDDWTPSYLRARGTANRDFAFRFADAQGMHSSSGTRYHGGVDWFAPGGTPFRSPQAGVVVEARDSGDTSGPVYGGTVKVRTVDGIVWVARHVNPTVSVGQAVSAGEEIARVTRWSDNPTSSHGHVECWRTLGGGYRIENAIDPAGVEWVEGAQLDEAEEAPTPPPPDGELRVTVKPETDDPTDYADKAAWNVLRHFARRGRIDPTTAIALAFRKTVWRYDPAAEPGVVVIRHPNGNEARRKGDNRYILDVIRTLVGRHLDG